MELIPYSHPFRLQEGFVPDAPPLDGIPDSVIAGQNSWYHNGKWISDRGASVSLGGTGGLLDLQVIQGQHAGCTGAGNLWSAFSAIWFVGNAFRNGLLVGNSPGVLSLKPASGPVVAAGLGTPPTAPGFVGTATTGRLSGAFSVVVSPFRLSTGAFGNRSAPSDSISVQNKKGLITFPLASSVPGVTHWIIGGSIRGVPGGPWYRCTNIPPVPVVTDPELLPHTMEIDWLNGELGQLMPINYDPPPPCTHVCALGGIVVALGTGDGFYGCRPSLVAFPESYPPEYGFDLPVREAITGVQPGLDGVVLVSTVNGLMALLLSGASGRPILARVIFGNVGFAKSNAFCSVYDQVYGYSSKAGMVRTHGGQEPDSSFAAPVQRYLADAGFTSGNTTVAFDQVHDAVLVCGPGQVVPFMRASNRWSAPITNLPGSVSAGIALNGVAYLQIGSNAYSVDSGGGSTWFLRSAYTSVSGDLNEKTLREFYGGGNSSMVHDLVVPDAGWGAGSTIGAPMFPVTLAAPFGAVGSRPKKPYRKFRAIAYKASGSAGGQTPLAAIIKGNVNPMA